jgi:hypothetical protein
MRTQLQIKQELERLRFDRKHQLPIAKIAQDSRCNQRQVTDAMTLNASETVLRRLDAYLDAGHLHHLDKDSKLLNRIEWLKNELYREYQARSIPMEDVMRLPLERQKRLFTAMQWRAKRLLREKIEKESGARLYFPDGLSYWRCKAKVIARGGISFKDRNARVGNRADSMAQRRKVQSGAHQQRQPAGLVCRRNPAT